LSIETRRFRRAENAGVSPSRMGAKLLRIDQRMRGLCGEWLNVFCLKQWRKFQNTMNPDSFLGYHPRWESTYNGRLAQR